MTAETVRARPATTDDMCALQRLEMRCFEREGPAIQRMQYLIESQGITYAALDGARIIGGMVVVQMGSGDEWNVFVIFVDVKYRRRGTARRLLRAFLGGLETGNKVSAVVGHDTVPFWRKAGFVVVRGWTNLLVDDSVKRHRMGWRGP